jgi:hypothetical protein
VNSRRFLRPGAVGLDASSGANDLELTAFRKRDGSPVYRRAKHGEHGASGELLMAKSGHRRGSRSQRHATNDTARERLSSSAPGNVGATIGPRVRVTWQIPTTRKEV